MTKIIEPATGYILVGDIKEDKLTSGLSIATEEGKKTQLGKVLRVSGLPNDGILGNFKKEYSIEELRLVNVYRDISIGHTVIFKKYGGNEIELDGNKYRLLAYEDVIGFVNEIEGN